MRNISFSLTTPQVRACTKTVTRRLGWANVKVGERLQGCEKCMGRKKGEPLVKLAVIEVVSVRRERLDMLTRYKQTGTLTLAKEGAYFEQEAIDEIKREGFPEMTPKQFVSMFCEHMRCQPSKVITRIEFKYV